MVHDDPNSRKPSAEACIYWDDEQCIANKYFPIAEISCFHEGNCDGFGTCRGCSKYDQGGMKFSDVDGQGGRTQTPLNLLMYNARAKIKPCCFWQGNPVEFSKGFVANPDISLPIASIEGSNPNFIITVGVTDEDILSQFPPAGVLVGLRDGLDPSGNPWAQVNIRYSGREGAVFSPASISPTGILSVGTSTLYLATDRSVPVFVTADTTPDSRLNQQKTFCVLPAAAPWQVAFTDENPTAYGCNGAKPECPFYTGPKFEHVVDAKMDTGDRVTASQVMELRYYSADWKSFPNPRLEWESRFQDPDIWAWVRDPNSTRQHPGSGRNDSFGRPMVQKVTINNFSSDKPIISIDPPQTVTAGTTTKGDRPNFPTLVKSVSDDIPPTLEVLWPKSTTTSSPFIKKTFSSEQQFIHISVQVASGQEVYAVNLTKNPQGELSHGDFIKSIRLTKPEELVPPIITGLPGFTFAVGLVANGSVQTVNHIRIFLSLNTVDNDYTIADVYIRHVFHHAHVAQTSFLDRYGHTVVDPWINHFTDIEIEASFLDLTGNTQPYAVYWNTITGGGKKTLYAIETVKETSSSDDFTWENIGCGNYIAITFHDLNINRVYPWAAWGVTTNGEELFVRVDRTGNNELLEGEESEIDLELAYATLGGEGLPANVVIFKMPGDEARTFLDPDADVITIKYVYTEYKQGPIDSGDLTKLKFPSDTGSVITILPFEITTDSTSMSVAGTFLKTSAGGKIRTCDEILGSCYTSTAAENEELARRIFFAGGVGEENIKSHTDIINECATKFNETHNGATFEDGTPITYTTAANKLANMYLLDGSQHYDVVFSDTEGRPIGVKRVGFLLQSSMVQARDVEIRYKWAAQMQYYAVNHGQLLEAIFYAPPFASQERLTRVTQQYDPYCGDHKETTPGNVNFAAFDLTTDNHGAMWYPYSRCQKPQYHTDTDQSFSYTVTYGDTVEGFTEEKRRYYWERMRFWDRFSPIIMSYLRLTGCFWQERTATINIFPPVLFTGYTKIRSSHPFGLFSVDREALRVSRHWEKRNISVTEETIKQESNGLSIEASEELNDTLFDENGDLKSGSETQTPIWLHINNGFSIVKPATEDMLHPFSNILLNRVGNHTFSEVFSDTRRPLNEIMVERDYTSNQLRSEDGSAIYIADESELNSAEGDIEEKKGLDVRWVFSDENTSWAWVTEPEQPVRGSPRITGLFITNPNVTFYKKNFRPATYATEGTHVVRYVPHTFDAEGNIETSATLTLDDGPELFISQTDGTIFILSDSNSPYDPQEHVGEDYQFVLHGNGPGGAGILADARGLQRYELAGVKYATLAGININLTFDIDELPYELRDISEIERLEGLVNDVIKPLIKVYSPSVRAAFVELLPFNGHYFVEKVEIDFQLGSDFDIPVVALGGREKGSSLTTDLAENTIYVDGININTVETRTVAFSVQKRMETITLGFGARKINRGMRVTDVRVSMRDHVERFETIQTFEPRYQISTGANGTHKPSDLEFYFQRSFPDFAKDFLSGQIALVQSIGSATPIAGTEVKYTGRQVKDLLPHFEFTDPINNRFPYNNIDLTAIPGYTETEDAAGIQKYIEGALNVASKGWNLVTNNHASDPLDNLTPNSSPPNVFNGDRPREEAQEELYKTAGSLLGDGFSVYTGFWHPSEKTYFSSFGVDLDNFSWTLTLQSSVASIDKIFRHENYGCSPEATNENLDGFVHRLENWQARGVFHQACDPRFSYSCFSVVMNKCDEFIFREYGTSRYLDNDVINRFTYHFSFPPNDTTSYIASDLINRGEVGGVFSGFLSPIVSLASTAGLLPSPSISDSPGVNGSIGTPGD